MRLDDLTASFYEFLSAGITIGPTFDSITDGAKKLAIQTEILAHTTDLAIAGLSSEAEATRLMSFALNAFNLNVATISAGVQKEAGVFADTIQEASRHISDYFAKAVEIGVVTAPQIAATFATVAATAKVAGIGIDEISAAYASQTTRGVAAARVTVSMNRAIQDLIQPSKGLRDVQERLGKNYAQIARTQGIHVAFEQMRLDAKRLGVDYRDLFKRQEGWRFALNITSDNINDANGNYQQYIRTLQRVRNSVNETIFVTNEYGERVKLVGSAAIQAFIRSDTISRNLIKLQEAFRSLGITIGYWFLQPLNNIVKGITRVIRVTDLWLQDLTPAQKELARQGAALLGVVTAFVALSGALQAFLIVATPIAPMIGLTATNLYGLQKVVGALFLPLGLLTGLLGGFAILVDNNVRGFGHFRHELDALKTLASGVVGVLQSVADGFAFVFRQISRGEDAGRAISHAVDIVGAKVQALGPAFTRVVTFIARLFLTIGQAIVQSLQVAIPAIIRWAISVGQTVAPVLARLAVQVGLAIARAIPGIVTSLTRFVQEVVTNIANFIATSGPRIANAALIFARALVQWVGQVAPQVLANLATLLGQILGWIASVAPVIAGAVGSWATAFATWVITDALPALLRSLGQLLANVANWLHSSQIIRQLTNAILTWAAAFITAMALIFSQVVNWIASNAAVIINAMTDVAAQIVAGIADFLLSHGAQIAAAALYIAVTFLASLAKGILADPTIIVKAIGLILLGTAVVSVVRAAGARLAFYLFAAKYYSTVGLASIMGVWSKIGAAVGPPLSAGIAHAISYAAGLVSRLGNLIIGAITRLWALVTSTGAAEAGAAGAANGAAYGAGMAAGASGGGFLATVSGIFTKITAAAAVAGRLAGTALWTAASTAVLALPLIVLAVGVKIVEDFGPMSGPNSNANILKRKAEREAAAAAQAASQAFKVNWAKTTFNTSDIVDLRDPAQAAQFQLDQIFGKGGPGELKIEPLDTSNILANLPGDARSSAEKAAANATEELSKITVPMSVVGDLQNQLNSIIASIHPVDKKTGKPSEKPKFTSDAARIKAIQGEIKTAQQNLALARKAEDSVTAGALQQFINDAQADIDKIKSAKGAIDESIRLNKELEAETARNLAELKARQHQSRLRRFGEPTSGKQSTQTAPKKPTEAEVERDYTGPYRRAFRTNTSLFTKWVADAGTAATNAGQKWASNVAAKQGAVTGAVSGIARAAAAIIANGSWFSYGAGLVGTLIAGLLSKLGAVTSASNQIAKAAGHALKAESPPKVGPLHLIDIWGERLTETYAAGIVRNLAIAEGAGLALAGAVAGGVKSGPNVVAPTFKAPLTVAMQAGPQSIVPISRGGGRWGSYEGDGGISDRELMKRNTELLGEIASSTSLGAAAAARSASVNPLASGPLPARGTLVSLRHLSHGRSI
jgi:TP901 family phage tail tape measure protein